MLALLSIWSFLGGGSAFRFGFGRILHPVNRRNCAERSAESTAPNFSAEDKDLCSVYDAARLDALMSTQRLVNACVYPAIDNSPFIIEKYPNPLNRTVQNILGRLPDVVDLEYLHTLPINDPRRHFLSTIQDPGPERRAELIENLQAIDAERGEKAKEESTYSLYQKLSLKGFDYVLSDTFEIAVMTEAMRRERPEFSEYESSDLCTNQLMEFTTKCLIEQDSSVVCIHPNMAAYFSFYNVSTSKLDELRYFNNFIRDISNEFFPGVIYTAIAESPIIAEKYPHIEDRTPHKLLGGLANIVSIEYMQSLEPHDPRRLFLDTLKPPSARRRVQLELNALLVDSAVTERQKYAPGKFLVRAFLWQLVRAGVQEVYLCSLQSAQVSEQLRRYAKNLGGEGADPEGDEYRKGLVGQPIGKKRQASK